MRDYPALVGGILLGLVGSLVLQYLGLGILAGNILEGDRGWADVLVPLLPGIAGVVLLSRRSTREAGVGFMMGLAIGGIVMAGICATIWIPASGG